MSIPLPLVSFTNALTNCQFCTHCTYSGTWHSHCSSLHSSLYCYTALWPSHCSGRQRSHLSLEGKRGQCWGKWCRQKALPLRRLQFQTCRLLAITLVMALIGFNFKCSTSPQLKIALSTANQWLCLAIIGCHLYLYS